MLRRHMILRAISKIALLTAALLIAGLTLGCSADLQSGGTPTDPSTDPPTETPPPSNPPNPGTAPFSDRTTESGFGGLRLGPALPSSPVYELGIIGGAAAGDVDNDGDIDLFVVTEGTGANTLYMNQGDGTFSATLLAPLSYTPLFESGPLFVDYDGDGFLDIIMGGVRSDADRDQLSSVHVYRNLGGLSFVDVSAKAGVTPPLGQDTYSIGAADINGDQTLDLFLSHWGSGPLTPLLVGGGFLWSNEGGGVFRDITTQAGLDDLRLTYTFAPNFSDIDGDADLDLLISSDFGTSRVFVNEEGMFRESPGSVLTDEFGMGSAVGDYDGDGDMDWFVSNILDPPDAIAIGGGTGNRLYQNDGSGTFTDVSESAGVREGFWGWGSCFADFDNDGWLDLFHVNGWRLGNTEFVADPSRLFMSNGDGTFTEASLANGLFDDGQGRGVVCFDADRDGDIDIFVSNNGDGPSFFMNQVAQTSEPFNYLGVVLVGPSPNTQGIGALITMTPSSGGTPSIGGTQVREIRAGSNFVSQDPAEAHFGLGDATSVDLSVRWPDGMVSNVSNVAANQLLVLSHPGA